MESKNYDLAGKEYSLKEKYSFKDWGNILKVIMGMDSEKPEIVVVTLLAEDKLIELLNLILDRPLEDELFEDDFEAAARAINDFFSRKKSLMKHSNKPSEN